MNALAPYEYDPGDLNLSIRVVVPGAHQQQGEGITLIPGMIAPYPVVVLETGPASSDETWTEPAVASVSAADSNDVLGEHRAVVMRPDLARQRWLALKRAHFKAEGRQARIEKALKALEEAVVHYDLDAETVRWIAEDADAEGL